MNVQIALEFDENAEGNIGDPLTATDADGDPRLYTITGGDLTRTASGSARHRAS